MTNKQTIFNYPLFALGFRAFFVLAGFSALVLIALWNNIYSGHLQGNHYYSGNYWHAHEMLFGYTTAVIAGFLLTAVRNWTGKSTVTGGHLAGLCLLWLYGRILPFYAGLVPDGLIAIVDFAFIPLLAYLISIPIQQSRHYKSYAFIGFLFLMALGNGMIHLDMLGVEENLAWRGFILVLAAILLIILVIAGRVFPFFTERGLKRTIALRNPTLDIASIASALLVFVLQFFEISGGRLAITAIAAALINIRRVADWYTSRVWYVPLLWVLYTGYAWIILGFILTAFSAFLWVLPTLPLHAFTMGGIGVLTLGMMSRVSLGHAGRELKASKAITAGFVLLNLGAMIRVLLPVVFTSFYSSAVYISTFCWLAAFSLFIFVYLPILTSPRIDGKPG